jgi:hypothetical protein
MLLGYKYLGNILRYQKLCDDQAVFLDIENEYTLWSNAARFSSLGWVRSYESQLRVYEMWWYIKFPSMFSQIRTFWVSIVWLSALSENSSITSVPTWRKTQCAGKLDKFQHSQGAVLIELV